MRVDSSILGGVEQKETVLYEYRKKDLQKVIPYLKTTWGKQNDRIDKKTNFIYKAIDFEDLLYEHRKNPFENFHYAARRYYNHQTSKTAERIFCSYNICKEEKNELHKEIDFYILNKPFDLKLTSFPRGFKTPKENKSDRQYRNELIRWFYKHQSKQGRYHEGNRIFIVCKHKDGKNNLKNNLLKMEFEKIHFKIEQYLLYTYRRFVAGYEPFNQVTLHNNKKVYSDVIFVT